MGPSAQTLGRTLFSLSASSLITKATRDTPVNYAGAWSAVERRCGIDSLQALFSRAHVWSRVPGGVLGIVPEGAQLASGSLWGAGGGRGVLFQTDFKWDSL